MANHNTVWRLPPPAAGSPSMEAGANSSDLMRTGSTPRRAAVFADIDKVEVGQLDPVHNDEAAAQPGLLGEDSAQGLRDVRVDDEDQQVAAPVVVGLPHGGR